jgi:hypothetical protein
MTGDGYQSDTAAQFAGNQALADFLSDLSKEEKRPRKAASVGGPLSFPQGHSGEITPYVWVHPDDDR